MYIPIERSMTSPAPASGVTLGSGGRAGSGERGRAGFGGRGRRDLASYAVTAAMTRPTTTAAATMTMTSSTIKEVPGSKRSTFAFGERGC